MVLSLSLVLFLVLSLSPPCNPLSPAPPTWLGGPDWGKVHYFYTRQFGLPDPGWSDPVLPAALRLLGRWWRLLPGQTCHALGAASRAVRAQVRRGEPLEGEVDYDSDDSDPWEDDF